ncbi:hypothetical protein D3C76_1453470 [compost metagenome]
MGPKSRLDCQERDENRVSTQIFGLLINQRQQILRSYAVFKTVPAFFHSLGRFLPVTTDRFGLWIQPVTTAKSGQSLRGGNRSSALAALL